MSAHVIWLDSEKAHIFNLTTKGPKKSSIQKSGADHHTQNKNDQHTDAHLDAFFKDLTSKLQGANELLLLGPGLAKTHFKTYLEKHSPQTAKQIVGMETSDHPTDNQILAAAGKFFTTYDLFNTPVI